MSQCWDPGLVPNCGRVQWKRETLARLQQVLRDRIENSGSGRRFDINGCDLSEGKEGRRGDEKSLKEKKDKVVKRTSDGQEDDDEEGEEEGQTPSSGGRMKEASIALLLLLLVSPTRLLR